MLTPEFIKQLNIFCLIAETMQKFTEVMESGIKSTDPFVIIFLDFFSIYQIDKAEKCCCRSHEAESFVMLFLDASIYQGTECILSHCRKDPVIY